MNENETIDPYCILDLPCGAKEEEIHEAFRTKLEAFPKGAKERERVILAYGMIRHLADRNQFHFDEVRSFFVDPLQSEQKGVIDKEALAQELAFLSSWEAGDDACLN